VSVAKEDPIDAQALYEVRVPDIGEFKDVPVIEVLVKAGDAVAKDAPLIVLESDKATLDVPAPRAGVVHDVGVKLGDRVSQGSLLLRLVSTSAAVATPAPTLPAMVTPTIAAVTALAPAATPAMPDERTPVRASPALRKRAREIGVDLARVAGSGPGGRLQREDLDEFVRRELERAPSGVGATDGGGLGLLPWPQVDFAKFGPVERKPLSRVKRISGANLARNWVIIPHVTNFDEADITDLEAFRNQVNREPATNGVKLTMLAFVIKACVGALQRYPEFNTSLDGEELVHKRYFHIGFAADTPNGLMVPVIRDVDRKGLLQIAGEAAELAALARQGKLKAGELQGGCFSVSSLGGIGGTGFTPIINAPEVAILGVSRAQLRPVWDGSQFAPRLMLPLGLSWDHRVVDGVAAARFLVHLAALLADFRRALL
jgi:pyruvate dehydrogenase E2 component (dihydrolipoamide acetyltransferase)